MDPLSSITILAAAMFAGFMGALLGIGGGSIMVPVFTVTLGINVKVAVATSLTALIATSAISSSVYLRKRLVNLRLAVVLEGATIVGSVTGASIAAAIPDWAVETMFGIVLFYAFTVMIYRTLKPPKAKETGGGRFSYYDDALRRVVSYDYRNLPAATGLSFFAGMASGMLGIGGGTVKVPILDLVAGLPMKAAVATSSYMIGITASGGSLVYLFKGLIDPHIVALAVVGIIVGSRLGAAVMTRLRSRVLRIIFSVFLAYYAVRMLMRGAAGWWS